MVLLGSVDILICCHICYPEGLFFVLLVLFVVLFVLFCVAFGCLICPISFSFAFVVLSSISSVVLFDFLFVCLLFCLSFYSICLPVCFLIFCFVSLPICYPIVLSIVLWLLFKVDCTSAAANESLGDGNPSFKRKLSKREKKELKKKEKEQKVKGKENDSGVAEKLYNELPESSFTRSISNPELVMRKRRQLKLEKKLQQIRSNDGGPDSGRS